MPPQTVCRERSLIVQPGVLGMAVTVWLWRFWKWLSRLFTRKSEIQRFTEAKLPLEKRTLNIGTHTHNSAVLVCLKQHELSIRRTVSPIFAFFHRTKFAVFKK